MAAAVKTKEPTYTKKQVCSSKVYAGYYDVFDNLQTSDNHKYQLD